jgi:hypothetical protein
MKAKKVVPLNESQLRGLIEDALTEVSMGQAKTQGPLQDLTMHLNGAKKALGELFQTASDQKASDQCQALLNGVTKMLKALEHMPELTKDPWSHVGKRG